MLQRSTHTFLYRYMSNLNIFSLQHKTTRIGHKYKSLDRPLPSCIYILYMYILQNVTIFIWKIDFLTFLFSDILSVKIIFENIIPVLKSTSYPYNRVNCSKRTHGQSLNFTCSDFCEQLNSDI